MRTYAYWFWRSTEMLFTVEVIIENKKMAKDPEGETIAKELINRGGFSAVRSVRAGKYLRLMVEAEKKEDAERLVTEMSNALRIFNPVAHTCAVRTKSEVE
jgi:phosphoribosylformylglycinamidine synthase PurS subunit